jgi:hypothetical protein
MDKHLTIPTDELADFMNDGWPGVDWYLTEHAEYRGRRHSLRELVPNCTARDSQVP